MTDIEMMAIDKKLLPQCQRYIPPSWFKLKAVLKKKQGYKLTWPQVSYPFNISLPA